MKKVFTLLALLTCFLGANSKEVTDVTVNFADYTDISQVPFASWRGSESAFARLSIKDGCLHFESSEATDPSWDCQFFPIGGVTADVGTVYTLHYKIKGDHAGNVSMLGFGQTPYGQFPITTDWVEGTVDYEATSADGNILMQCGDWIGSWDIAYLKITHEERENQRPKEWLELITDDGTPTGKWMGDAETPWGDLANVKFTETDKTIFVSAWGKEKGVNLNADGGWDPFPATIETDPDDASNHVFVVHGKVADTEGDASGWDNQFWIMSTKELKVGERYKFHFRYKASEAAQTNTQMHSAQPSDYLHYQVLGDVNFTTEWQEYDQEVVIPTPQNNRPIYSIAFNLNPYNKNAVDFYFDDLSIQELKLDEGWFVAGSNATLGLSYDFDNAVEFVQDSSDEALVVATIGTVGKSDTWVDKVMISTRRGFDSSFKANTIKPIRSFTNDPDDWPGYESASNYEIKLPAAGVWKISIDITDQHEMNFVKLEGEEDRQPLEEIANTTVNIVKGLERDDLSDVVNGQEQQREEVGGTGEAWDNQFFIVANRELKAGEATILKFKYKSNVADAKTTTQCHGEPGGYLHYAAIGDVTFQPEEQVFDQTFTVPAEADGMKSIAFNMAEIKGACDYEIYDVIWMTEDHMETLIDTEGDKNFYVKVGAGTNPYVVSGISNVVNESKASNVTYNLAGQRVSKGYKGIVIKNGAKYIAK